MGFIALKVLDMPDGSKRRIGEAVPEAAKWHNPETWMRMGHIVWIPDGQEEAFKKDLMANRYSHAAAVAPHVTVPALGQAAMRMREAAGHHPLHPVGVEPEAQPALLDGDEAPDHSETPGEAAAKLAASLEAELTDNDSTDDDGEFEDDLAVDNDDAPSADKPAKAASPAKRKAKAKGKRRNG